MIRQLVNIIALLFLSATLLNAQDTGNGASDGDSGDSWDDGDDWGDDDWEDDITLPELHGFAELAAATRFNTGPAANDELLLTEARFRLDISHAGDVADLLVKADFIADDVTGRSRFDLRQAYVNIRAADWLDIRAGRQILTWGTGDFVFLNDLFPKDFVSFFAGRDDEFLKAPSTAVKFALYSEFVKLDLIWTPVFAPDRFISGERLTFFSPGGGTIVGPAVLEAAVDPVEPDRSLKNGEFAARIYQSIGSAEISLYGSAGFIKQPQAFNTDLGLPTYSALNTFGASIRTPLLGGLANAEAAYYHSADDADGDDPFVPNSQLRILAGFEHEIIANLTGSAQYYLEQTQDYDLLILNSPAAQFEPEENRQWLTARLTLNTLQQTLRLGVFTIYSLEGSAHIRASAHYQWSDALSVNIGALVMDGTDAQFFGGLRHNSNVYARVRYGF